MNTILQYIALALFGARISSVLYNLVVEEQEPVGRVFDVVVLALYIAAWTWVVRQ